MLIERRGKRESSEDSEYSVYGWTRDSNKAAPAKRRFPFTSSSHPGGIATKLSAANVSFEAGRDAADEGDGGPLQPTSTTGLCCPSRPVQAEHDTAGHAARGKARLFRLDALFADGRPSSYRWHGAHRVSVSLGARSRRGRLTPFQLEPRRAAGDRPAHRRACARSCRRRDLRQQEDKAHDIIAANFADIAPSPKEREALRKQALDLLQHAQPSTAPPSRSCARTRSRISTLQVEETRWRRPRDRRPAQRPPATRRTCRADRADGAALADGRPRRPRSMDDGPHRWAMRRRTGRRSHGGLNKD